ncbi:MAG: hypothetical protein AB7T06_13235 [Kofleriaceae bacterium]
MRSVLFATLLLGAACSVPAQADQLAPPTTVLAAPHIAIASAPAKVRAPYDVQIMRESGETMPTYAKGDRYYVQGNANERYIIRIVNPTGNRVEAVVTVDGLDVVDGEPGDLRKRGYVVPPYGETRIEGFRTSTEDVATFRFSSVDDSYAGKKGKARNVGVVAVAIFEEQAAPVEQQQIIVGGNTYGNKDNYRRRYDYEGDLDTASRDLGGRGEATGASRADRTVSKADKAPRTRQMRESEAPSTTSVAPSAPPPNGGGRAPRAEKKALDYDDFDGDGAVDASEEYYQPAPAPQARKTERPGLGTEFGEQRYSAASYTKFVRAADRPIAIAELRYNDAAGLMALGIPVVPLPDEGEINTRETADPFPGDTRFSRAP